MKLKCEVLKVSSNGDSLSVVMQARTGRADWKPIERQMIHVDNTKTNQRSFYVGRTLTLEVRL